MDKNDIYKRIKIAGMISFIPAVLVGSIFSGYLAGSYLEKRFGLASFVTLIGIGVGLLVAVYEAVRIIRKVLSIDSKS